MPCSINLEDVNAINTERLNLSARLIKDAKAFVEQVYIPDLMAIAGFYKDWGAIGGGLKNYLVYGDLPTNGYNIPSSFKFPRGAILDRDLSKVFEVDREGLTGDQGVHRPLLVRVHGGDKVGMHPWKGETEFNYTGPKPPYEAAECGGQVLAG